jgi:hypothetical protein
VRREPLDINRSGEYRYVTSRSVLTGYGTVVYREGIAMIRLSGFKSMTFDCYGTLVDWEAPLERRCFVGQRSPTSISLERSCLNCSLRATG